MTLQHSVRLTLEHRRSRSVMVWGGQFAQWRTIHELTQPYEADSFPTPTEKAIFAEDVRWVYCHGVQLCTCPRLFTTGLDLRAARNSFFSGKHKNCIQLCHRMQSPCFSQLRWTVRKRIFSENQSSLDLMHWNIKGCHSKQLNLFYERHLFHKILWFRVLSTVSHDKSLVPFCWFGRKEQSSAVAQRNENGTLCQQSSITFVSLCGKNLIVFEFKSFFVCQTRSPMETTSQQWLKEKLSSARFIPQYCALFGKPKTRQRKELKMLPLNCHCGFGRWFW